MFNQVVIVDNLPVVEMKRFQKLQKVTTTIFSKHGEIKDINIPSTDGKTLGFAFIEYDTAEGAETAVKQGDRHRLDKSHTLRVNFYQDYEKMLNVCRAFLVTTAHPLCICSVASRRGRLRSSVVGVFSLRRLSPSA